MPQPISDTGTARRWRSRLPSSGPLELLILHSQTFGHFPRPYLFGTCPRLWSIFCDMLTGESPSRVQYQCLIGVQITDPGTTFKPRWRDSFRSSSFGCVWFFALPAAAQRDRGELQIEVHDPQGATLSASGELISEGNQFHLDFTIGDDGRYAAQDLAFGVYRVSVSHSGFVPAVQLVEIRSMVPQHLSLTLGLKPIETQLQVSETETLVDPSRTSAVYTIGSQTIGEQLSPQPGRGVIDVVDAQPGWLQEANGVLHPRGSEYDVQFVVDGLPMTENRSPGFAPPIESSDVESMRVMTAGFPAEYGRKLGGVVEVTSPKNNPAGLHGEFEARRREFLHGFGQRRSFLFQRREPIFRYRRWISLRPISRPAGSPKLHKYRERRRIFILVRARFFKWRPPFPDIRATRGSLPGAERAHPAGGRPAPGLRAEGNLRPGSLHARLFGRISS